MAVGTGIGFNFSDLVKQFDKLDKQLDKLIQKGKGFETTMVDAFKNMTKSDFKKFSDGLKSLRADIVDFGKHKVGIKWDSASLQNYIDNVNRLIYVIKQVRKDASKSQDVKGISILGLRKEVKDAQELLRLVKKAEQAYNASKTSRNQTYSGAIRYSNNANTLEKERIAIENLKAARDKLKQSDANYAVKLNALNEAIKRHEKNLKDATKTDKDRADEAAKNAKKIADAQARYDSISRRERYKAYTTSYEGAIKTSDKANTIAKEIQAVKNLEAARAKLNKTSADYEKKLANINNRIKKHNENIDKATKGAKKLREEHQSLGQAAGGLGRMLASAFSIQAIRGYINQMIKVRGEFELQQRSLQAILQNKDAADELWQKTIDLAVRSPFRVKELVTYTKQLAAYRIESEKLFETNKMLADVSAGLGVDMSRLILAFGQVRSASFLRGTELRQFTEAGIPMLEELAKYFTELEGRAVSVGDVFERITKRMVSFADVEEVFKRITSEGGTFYRMQEIQAETLQGQISNLKDSIDIMLNDMGKSYDSTLKNMVSLTKSLVDNWRTVSSIAIPIVGALVARWGIFKIATTKNAEAIAGFAKTFGRHFGVVITQLTRGTRVAKQFAKSTQVSIMSGWTTVILAVVAALTILVKTIQNANRVKRELEKIDLSGAFDASRSVAEYKKLAEVVADTSKSYDEQQKALSTLKTKYADILPSHLLESKTIKALGGDYGEATRAIYDYIAAKTKEKQIEVIQSEFGGKIEEQAQDLTDDIKKALEKVAPNIKKSDVLPIVNRLQEMIQLGEVDLFNVDEALSKLVMEFTGLEISSRAWKDSMGGVSGELSLLDGNAAQLVVSISNLKEKMDEVSASSLSWQDSFVYQDFNKVREGYEKQSEAIGKYYETIRRYEQERENKGENGVSDELKRDYEAATNALNNIFTEAKQKAPEWSTIINEPFKLNEATINANKILWEKMIADINAMLVLPSKSGAKQNYVELLEDELEAFAGTAKQQEVARVAQDLADTMRVSLEGLDELFLKSDESLSDYAKRISGTLEQYKTGVLQFDTDIKNGTKFGDYTKEQVSLMREQIPFLEEFLRLFEAFLTPKKGNAEDTFSPMLRTVKEIYQEFKKLQGSFDDLTAKEGALAKFGDAFKEAFDKTPEQMGFDLFSEEGVKAAYDYLISKAPDAKKKIQAQLAKGEIVWDVKLQKKKDADKELLDDIQELFDKYDLSLELKKLNIPSDLAKSLFNVDYLDLEGLKKAVQDQEAKFIGTDMEDEYKEFLDKIEEMEKKASVERMKTYSKYLMEGMNERVKLKIEELKKLKEVEESKEFNPDQKKRIKERISKEARAEQDKLAWKDFQGTEMYTMMFEDLEFLGTKALEALKTKLTELKSSLKDLPADEVKEIINQISKIEDITIQRNPFASLRDAMKEVKALQKEGMTEDVLQKTYIEADAKRSLYQEELDAIELIINKKSTGIDLTQQSAEWQDKYAEYLGMTTDELNVQAIVLRGNLMTQKNAATTAKEGLDAYADARKSLSAVANEWGTFGSLANKAWDSAKTIMESIGVESDSLAMTIGDTAMSMVDLVFQGVQFGIQLQIMSAQAKILGVEMNAALGPIGWVVLGLQAVATLIQAIFGAKDKALQKQIEASQKDVEELQKKYEELEESIENAWNVESIKQYNKDLQDATKEMIKAQEAAIAAQEQRKGANKEGSDAYNELQDMYNELDEMEMQLAESLEDSFSKVTDGILDSVFDAAKEFTDAWHEAYKETGDGLKGLEENFEEMFLSLAKNQAAMQITGAFVEQWKRELEQYINDEDTKLTANEAKKWAESVRNTFPELSAALENYFDAIGGVVGIDGAGLSALEKGISGITEDQAEILAAYWNASRMSLSSIDSKMDLVLANMGVSSDTENNPMLVQLRTQTGYMKAIRDILDGTTRETSAIYVKLAN